MSRAPEAAGLVDGSDVRSSALRSGDRQRHYLFLQGPLSALYRRIGAELARAGHRVSRVNFCAGDWLDWPGATARSYRGPYSAWPDHIADLLDREGVTDLVLHGDTRPYHREAVLAAQARGLAVHVSELGLLRPGFMTLERGGLVTLSRFPADPQSVRAIASQAEPVDLSPCFPGSFALEAWQDVTYHLANVLLSFRYPHHRRHTPQAPLADYACWVRRLLGSSARKAAAEKTERAHLRRARPFFLLPLQVEGDYQVRAHSPFGTMRQALGHILASFATHAPAHVDLLVKTHPLDNGASDWRAVIASSSAGRALGERVVLLDGGNLDTLLARAQGVVTVNSTAGLEALRADVPVKALAPALYDMPGLTHQGGLDGFWQAPKPAEPELVVDFVTALAATTQVRGSIHNREGLGVAVREITSRLLEPAFPEPVWMSEAPPPRLAAARILGVPL